MSDYSLPQSPLPLSPKLIKRLKGWVYDAAQIANHYFKRVSYQRKADDTFVTKADLEIEDFLIERLRAEFPQDGIIAEEQGRQNWVDQHETIWTLDPLDGTTSFIKGLPGWGIALGRLHRGKPDFGLVYLPLTGGFFCTDKRENRRVCTNWQNKGFLAVNAGAATDFEIDPTIERTRTLGGISANLAYTASGAAVATLIHKAFVWDLVPGAAIIQQAGGDLRYLSGRPIDYSQLLNGQLAPEPIIAGHPSILDDLTHRIRPRSLVALDGETAPNKRQVTEKHEGHQTGETEIRDIKSLSPWLPG